MAFKRVFLSLFLLFSTHGLGAGRWEFDPLSSSSSKRLTYKETHSPQKLELSFIKTQSGKHLCISLLGTALCSTNSCFINIGENSGKKVVEAKVLKGRQKLLLPHSIAEEMVQALAKGQQVQVQVDLYSTTLTPDHFSKNWALFLK